MLTPHNPLNIAAVPMGIKELIFPFAWDLLEGDIFIIEYIIYFHPAGFNLQKPDPSQVSGRRTFVLHQEKASKPSTQD